VARLSSVNAPESAGQKRPRGRPRRKEFLIDEQNSPELAG
jgi:hypothetical protein